MGKPLAAIGKQSAARVAGSRTPGAPPATPRPGGYVPPSAEPAGGASSRDAFDAQRPVKKKKPGAGFAISVGDEGGPKPPVAERPKPVVRVTEKEAKENAQQTAEGLIVSANTLAGAAFGDECRMNKFEEKTIAASLERVMARLEPGTMAAINERTDLVVLCIALLGWSIRIVRTVREREEAEQAKQAPAQPQGSGNNGQAARPLPASQGAYDPSQDPEYGARLAKALGYGE